MAISAARRMQDYRERCKLGLQYVRALLHVTDVEALIAVGLLKSDQRHDPEALERAVTSLVGSALEPARDAIERGLVPPLRVTVRPLRVTAK